MAGALYGNVRKGMAQHEKMAAYRSKIERKKVAAAAIMKAGVKMVAKENAALQKSLGALQRS